MDEMKRTRQSGTAGLPPAQGLYHPANEHDACGMGFVANCAARKAMRSFSRAFKF